MSGEPISHTEADLEGVDFDLDLDDLDDEALQRLLDEDPSLEEELRAIEEAAASESDAPPPHEPAVAALSAGVENDAADQLDALPPLAEALSEAVEGAADRSVQGEDAPFVAAPSHDDLADFSVDDEEDLPPVAVSDPSTDDIDLSDEFELDVVIPPIPRINIHAFCSSDEMSALVDMVSGDRRMSKAHVTLQAGGAVEAAEFYGSSVTPNLIFIEAGTSVQQLLRGLDDLAQVCDPSTRVIVIGAINDIRLYRELMDRGISEYIVRPKTPVQLISAVGGLYADPSAPALGKTYSFVGARGGVGSSTISHNVAWALATNMLSDTILVDFDLAFGTAGLDFEQDPTQGLAEALAAPERLDDVLLDRLLQSCTDRLSILGAPNLLDRDYDLPRENFESIVDMVRKSAPSIVVDLPHVWTGWCRHVLQLSDEIVVTATPDLSSFRNAKNIIESINAYRSNDAPPVLVLNQVGIPKRPEVPIEQFEEALELKVKAVVPWDPALLGECATTAQPMMEVSARSKATQAVNDLARQLLGQDSASKGGNGFSLSGLLGLKK